MLWRLFSLVLLVSLLMSGVPVGIEDGTSLPRCVAAQSVSFENTDLATLWVRRNGSDPEPFGYGGANLTPMQGVNFFTTKSLVVYVDTVDAGEWKKYSWTDLNNTALFPADAEIWIMEYPSVVAMEAVAQHAVWDTRIRGFMWDDFPVGTHSPANMSARYSALHWEDNNLSQGPLELALVCYNRDYFKQSPYTWNDIRSYFDAIHFWYYPFTYSLLYPGLAGYEDDFLTLRSWMPEKSYSLGIYLHYYNLGDYPYDFTREQMSIASRLIKEGKAERFVILENFWIQHNRATAEIVKAYLDEYNDDYRTTWYYPTTILSYRGETPLVSRTITDISWVTPPDFDAEYTADINNSLKYGFLHWIDDDYVPLVEPYFMFKSGYLQNLTIRSTGTYIVESTVVLIDIRTGNMLSSVWDYLNLTASFIIEKNITYRVENRPWQETPFHVYSNYAINSEITWTNRHITFHGKVWLNSTLRLTNCVIRFATNNYENDLVNLTEPDYGIVFGQTDSVKLIMSGSIIEPANRAYPYVFQREWTPGVGDEQLMYIYASYIACYWGTWYPAGYLILTDSTIYQSQPTAETYDFSLRIEGTNNWISRFIIKDCLLWAYDRNGKVPIFVMPGALTLNPLIWLGGGLYPHSTREPRYYFSNNTIAGGQYGLWVDMTYSNTALPFRVWRHSSYPNSALDIFVEFRFDGPLDRYLEISTNSIFEWSIKGAIPGPNIQMDWVYIRNGIWHYVSDTTDEYIQILDNRFSLIMFTGSWLAYRNNYSLTLFTTAGLATDTASAFEAFIWLLIFFLPPIAISQVMPKIGFIFGTGLMLLIFGIGFLSFLPYMALGFAGLIALIWSGDES